MGFLAVFISAMLCNSATQVFASHGDTTSEKRNSWPVLDPHWWGVSSVAEGCSTTSGIFIV